MLYGTFTITTQVVHLCHSHWRALVCALKLEGCVTFLKFVSCVGFSSQTCKSLKYSFLNSQNETKQCMVQELLFYFKFYTKPALTQKPSSFPWVAQCAYISMIEWEVIKMCTKWTCRLQHLTFRCHCTLWCHQDIGLGCWIRSRAHRVQLSVPHSGTPDASKSIQDNKIPRCCHSLVSGTER